MARQIRARAPASKFLFLTDSQSTQVIWQEGFTSVKMLPAEAVRRGLVDVDVKYALNPALVADTLAGFRPDVFVADTYPIGRTGELYGVFPAMCRAVLIYLEQPDELRLDPALAANMRLYDLVLAPYAENEVRLPPGVSGVGWTGYFLLRSRAEGLSRAEARRRLGLPEDGFIVYVGFGGGGDTRHNDFVTWALRQANRFPDWTFALLMPPLFQGPAPVISAKNVVTFRYFPVAEVLPAFDAAISALGLNSMAELLHFGVPSVFMPRPGLSDDHMGRAIRLRKAGAALVVPPFDDAALGLALDKLADSKVRDALADAGRRFVPGNGAENAAAYLIDWATKRKPPRRR